VAVDETKADVDGTKVFVWAAVNCETLEVLHVDVTPGHSSFDALLFFEKCCDGAAVARCCG
jgi:putative transposase